MVAVLEPMNASAARSKAGYTPMFGEVKASCSRLGSARGSRRKVRFLGLCSAVSAASLNMDHGQYSLGIRIKRQVASTAATETVAISLSEGGRAASTYSASSSGAWCRLIAVSSLRR